MTIRSILNAVHAHVLWARSKSICELVCVGRPLASVSSPLKHDTWDTWPPSRISCIEFHATELGITGPIVSGPSVPRYLAQLDLLAVPEIYLLGDVVKDVQFQVRLRWAEVANTNIFLRIFLRNPCRRWLIADVIVMFSVGRSCSYLPECSLPTWKIWFSMLLQV
jgi:hypothetical protein